MPGARPGDSGVTYRVWAPKASAVQVEVRPAGTERLRRVALGTCAGGYFEGIDGEGMAGDRYRYVLEGHGTFPDPVSRGQEKDVHGASVVVDPDRFCWTDEDYRSPVFRDLVIYEMHVGTFTADGTFQAAIERLSHLRNLGVTAVEIMPVADFPGNRNWGYDGVLIYAPARCYGSPDDLRALVDAAHGFGLAVILDVVYNHFGPDGNYLSRFSDHYFSRTHHTPWGAAFNFDGESSGPVREFFKANPIYWMEEFHIDGFRFDATHQIIDESVPHILAEMTEAIHARGGFVMAEDDRNEAGMITPVAAGGVGFDGVWADDFHHSARVCLTGEQASYYANFGGSAAEMARTLREGWFYTGQAQKRAGSRGTPASHLPPERFIHCITNHDQVGNRGLGERLHHLTSPSAYRALSALLCLSPYTPLLFMGQEWGASSPFLYFTDHHGELGRRVTEGRRREFASFLEYDEPAEQARIPDPQDPETFQRSKLSWHEMDKPGHGEILTLYRECLRLRVRFSGLRPKDRRSWEVRELPWGAVAIGTEEAGHRLLLIFDLVGGHSGLLDDAEPGGRDWKLVFSTEELRFGGAEKISFSRRRLAFTSPGLALLEALR